MGKWRRKVYKKLNLVKINRKSLVCYKLMKNYQNPNLKTINYWDCTMRLLIKRKTQAIN
jgi:hypothetical protein